MTYSLTIPLSPEQVRLQAEIERCDLLLDALNRPPMLGREDLALLEYGTEGVRETNKEERRRIWCLRYALVCRIVDAEMSKEKLPDGWKPASLGISYLGEKIEAEMAALVKRSIADFEETIAESLLAARAAGCDLAVSGPIDEIAEGKIGWYTRFIPAGAGAPAPDTLPHDWHVRWTIYRCAPTADQESE